MDEKRMGEIALVLVRHYIRKEPISLDKQTFKRHLYSIAQALPIKETFEAKISREELSEFFEILLREAINAIFPIEK